MDPRAALELDAAQALFAARMLEAAVHDKGPWTFKWGEIEVPATKEISERGVVFTGRFPENDVRPVFLSNSEQVAFVSPEDHERTTRHSWWLSEHGYVKSTLGNGAAGQVYLHQFIVGPEGPSVDHRNGDKLDNRRRNLRPCTQSQNGANAKISRANTSGYKGVSWHKASQKWKAQITVNRTTRYLGIFSDPVDAARAYDQAAVEEFGEFALTNFDRPETGLLILCDGVVMGMRSMSEFEHPGDTGFEVTWSVLSSRGEKVGR